MGDELGMIWLVVSLVSIGKEYGDEVGGLDVVVIGMVWVMTLV